MPGAGVTGVGTSTAGQPFGIPTTPIGTVPTSGTSFQAPSISSGISTVGGDNTALGDYQQTYGKGAGTQLFNSVANLGTATNSAVQATNAEVLAAADRQKANMRAQQAAQGVSPDSSSAALASSDFEAQVNRNLTAVDSQMELGGLDTLLASLQSEGSKHGQDESGWDVFGDVLNAGAGIAGTLIGTATGLGSLGSIFGKAGSSAGSGIIQNVAHGSADGFNW
jgi:hypothetical protein